MIDPIRRRRGPGAAVPTALSLIGAFAVVVADLRWPDRLGGGIGAAIAALLVLNGVARLWLLPRTGGGTRERRDPGTLQRPASEGE